jgi:phosphoglycerate dehydrogenase-like enzyme
MTASINTILVCFPMFDEGHVERIRRAAPDANVAVIESAEAWDQQRAELEQRVDVMIGWAGYPGLTELPGSLPNLRWFQQIGAGADWLMKQPELANSDLILTSASGVHAIPIAEHILALMLTLSRRIHRFAQAQRDHQWRPRGRPGELDGSTIGIIGLGAIGQKTAEKARGLNMRVLGLRRDVSRSCEHVERIFAPPQLHELLAESDWVVLSASHSRQTDRMIGDAELDAMKSSAYLINIARGGIVDEAALIRALQAGSIAGAGLDVFEAEPLAENSPLWDMGNVIITPHYAGNTPHYADRVVEIFSDNLRRYLAGEPLRNLVDKQQYL